jgi:hypothetical protein
MSRPHNFAARMFSLAEHCVYLIRRADVVSQFDTWGAMATDFSPEPKDHAARLKEDNLVVGLQACGPSHRFVESARARQVLDAERHQTDALIHAFRPLDTGL